MAGHCCISLDCARGRKLKLAVCLLLTVILILPWYIRIPESLCRLANYKGLAEMATAGILSLGLRFTSPRGSNDILGVAIEAQMPPP